MDKSYQPAPDAEVLPTQFSIPGLGFLPIYAFIIKAKEPVPIDTRIGNDRGECMKALESVIDPRGGCG